MRKEGDKENMDDLFYRLYYRERVGRLSQAILLQLATPDVAPRYNLTLEDIGELLQEFVEEAENNKLCHHMYKSMYFCTRKKGHKGCHSQDRLLKWERDA